MCLCMRTYVVEHFSHVHTCILKRGQFIDVACAGVHLEYMCSMCVNSVFQHLHFMVATDSYSKTGQLTQVH